MDLSNPESTNTIFQDIAEIIEFDTSTIIELEQKIVALIPLVDSMGFTRSKAAGLVQIVIESGFQILEVIRKL